MESQAKVRGKGAPSRYAEETVKAVEKDLRANMPRPNCYEIARKHGVGIAFVYYRRDKIRKAMDEGTAPREEGLASQGLEGVEGEGLRGKGVQL